MAEQLQHIYFRKQPGRAWERWPKLEPCRLSPFYLPEDLVLYAFHIDVLLKIFLEGM